MRLNAQISGSRNKKLFSKQSKMSATLLRLTLPCASRLVVEILKVEKLNLELLELIGKVVVFLRKTQRHSII